MTRHLASARPRYVTPWRLGAVILAVLAAIFFLWPDGRYNAAWFLGIPQPYVHRTDDLEPVRFKYSGRQNQSVFFKIPKAYLWFVGDQHSDGKSQFTGIDTALEGEGDGTGKFTLNPYDSDNRSLFDYEADSLVGIAVSSPPIWLPGGKNLSETTRLNLEDLEKINRQGIWVTEVAEYVSEIHSIGNVIWHSKDTNIRWFLVSEQGIGDWIAKCYIQIATAVANPLWRCDARYVDADGLEVRFDFPIRLVTAAPELRRKIDALLATFRSITDSN